MKTQKGMGGNMKKSGRNETMIRATPNIPEDGFILDETDWICTDVFEEAEREGIDIDKVREEIRNMKW